MKFNLSHFPKNKVSAFKMLPAETAHIIANPDYFAVIIFLNPRSPQWAFVRALCLYADDIMEGKGFHAAAFRCEERSIRTLTSICHIVQDWKTFHLFVKQKKIGHIYSIRWLDCYFQSLKCNNQNAWCLDITYAPCKKVGHIENNELFVCPCKQLSSYNWGRTELPVSFKDQFQAFAVERGVTECPNFNMDNFKAV